jgi:hypothetical protein
VSLRKEARDGEERCQFRRNNFKDDDISSAGVTMFVPVQRAAVHKRIKEGKLGASQSHFTRLQTHDMDWPCASVGKHAGEAGNHHSHDGDRE